jgi:Cu2+-containing amine oxidase
MASPRQAEKAAKPAKAKAKSAPAKNGKTNGKPTSKASKAQGGRKAPDIANADPALFDPLTPGEAADALRTLTEDKRLGSMAKVGRYRVICTEPLVVKPPHWMAGHRLARVVAYDYSSDRCVDACIDLDAGVVAHLELTKSQPMLSLDEEALAVSVAMSDERVTAKLGIGEGPQSTMHYWGRTQADVAFARRSAAVIFGRQGGHATLVAVVDLLDNQVTRVVPAELW